VELGARYAEDLSLAELARAVGVSRSRLCRAFRRATGTTLHAYRDGLRLRAALEALLERDDLTALALDLWYASHSHFGARFRRAFGMTPSEARRSGDRTTGRGVARTVGLEGSRDPA
jgi:AraC-like DNA-binding protein